MGQSFDGKLLYGIPLNSVQVYAYQERTGKDLSDVSEDWGSAHEPVRPDAEDRRGPEWNAWREALCAWEATPGHVEARWVGYLESDSEYVIHCPCIKKESDEGEIVEVDIKALAAMDMTEYDAKIREFCTFADVIFVQPKWILTGSMG